MKALRTKFRPSSAGYISISVYTAYPCSKFVVANTLAKLKKLEPNEINLSQGFSQKVVSTGSSFVFNSLHASLHV